MIVNAGNSISAVADDVFSKIEQDFDMLRLDRPETMQFKVRGLRSAELEKMSIDVVKNNG